MMSPFMRHVPLVLALLVAAPQAPAGLPTRLTDQEFWALSQESSEPGGFFRSADVTNLTSNETEMQYVIPDLVARVKADYVYLGVGPEQNFTYITALRPKMAVIFDIRRGNLNLQLMYKAIFELSKDRADFVSMLFSKPRLPAIGAAARADELFSAFASSETSQALYTKNLAAIRTFLTKTRGLPLSPADLNALETVYQAFYASGFYVRPSPSYADLMAGTDANGVMRGFLASEANFTILKDLQSRNLVVPVVGDFAGPKAIRAIGTYLKARGATVGAFYLSNVEQYLVDYSAFCRNVQSLPLDASSVFIRSSSGGGGFGRGGRGGNFVNSLGGMLQETRLCGR
jgi:hypothetical protein